MASRILGFARDMLIASRLGAGPVADAFFVALKLPNLFRRLFGEGAFNAAFVPAFAGILAAEGRAAADGYYPRIAGKPAGYLYNQLLHFREGRRHYGLMTRLLEPLSDAYLSEIAGHFASLDLPYPPPARVTATPAVLERGRLLRSVHEALLCLRVGRVRN